MGPRATKNTDSSPQGLFIVVGACVLMILLGGGLSRCGDKELEDVPPPSLRRSTDTTDGVEASRTGSRDGDGDTATDETSAPRPGEVPNPSSILVLVDRERFFADDHVPADLVEAPVAWAPSDDAERRLLREEAAAHLTELFAAAEADGRPLLGISAYRSHARQEQVHDRSMQESENGAGELYSARPGHSEHQSGLAVDVSGADGVCTLEPCFAATPAAHWIEDNAHRFGFVVRYPAGKEDVTGYAHEPWHLRYVGPEVAEELHASGLTLDEHLGSKD